MATVKERLERARIAAHKSIRSLQRDLYDAGIPGSSYANVHAYFRGKTKPPLEFIEAAAKELGANPEWIAFEKGWMTERERRAAEAEEEILRDADPTHPEQLSIGAMPGRPWWPFDYHEVARFAVIMAWRELVAAEGGPSGKVVEEGVGAGILTRSGQLFAELQNAVMAPIRILGLPQPDLEDEAFNDYAVAVAQAVRYYARAHRMDAKEAD